MKMKRMSIVGASVLIGAAILTAVPVSLHQSQNERLSLSMDRADARVGRPLTPGSVAGVARERRGGRYCAALRLLSLFGIRERLKSQLRASSVSGPKASSVEPNSAPTIVRETYATFYTRSRRGVP